MKKSLIFVLLSLAVLILIPLTGCGGDGGSDEDTIAEVRATAEGFMEATKEGDLEAMKEYCDPAVFEEGGSLATFSQLETLNEEFAKAVNVDVEDLSDTTKDTIHSFMDTLLTELVTDYEIGDITEEEGAYKVNVTTNYGYNPEKMQEIDLNDEIEEMATDYAVEHEEELTKAYDEGGEDAMISALLDGLMGDILDKYTKKILETGEVTQDSILTIEDRDGKWLITSDEAVAQ